MSELTEQEQQYFSTGGEVEITDTPSPEPATPAQEPAQPVEAAKPTETLPSEPAKPQEPADPPEVRIEKLNKALGESRGTAKELRAQLRQMEAAHQAAQARMAEFEKRLNPNGQQKPSFEENPAQYLQAENQDLRQKVQSIEQQQQQRDQLTQFRNWYAQQGQQFAQNRADFWNAYEFYTRDRAEQLVNAGLTQEQAHARVQFEEMELAKASVQLGHNPAAMIYRIAQERGYKLPAQPAENLERQLNSGQTTSTVAPNPSAKIEQIRRGMEANKPLSAVGGGGQMENLTWEYVANAPEHEFNQAWEKMMRAEAHR